MCACYCSQFCIKAIDCCWSLCVRSPVVGVLELILCGHRFSFVCGAGSTFYSFLNKCRSLFFLYSSWNPYYISCIKNYYLLVYYTTFDRIFICLQLGFKTILFFRTTKKNQKRWKKLYSLFYSRCNLIYVNVSTGKMLMNMRRLILDYNINMHILRKSINLPREALERETEWERESEKNLKEWNIL